MNYKIIERDAFQVIGVKQEFSCGNGNFGIPGVPVFWDDAHKSGTISQLVKLLNGQIKGLLGITTNFDPEKNVVDYWIAVEHDGAVPENFAYIEYPPAKWVVFEVRGPVPFAIIEAWKQIYSDWFPSNHYQPANLAPIEVYLDSELNSPNSYNEIWIAVK
ncbi:GyrI-like domain-containing protein [Neobacillus sp. LXY-4]|uniref:GyrI-like domain-containing protein n=1 Tax=Neobacillus sp. LXY-4 TaxID=3379826 RepID=UPI003EE20084